MSIDKLGTALTFPAGLAVAIAAGGALLMRKFHTARNLGIAAYILLWPVYLWFLQFELTKRGGGGTFYIFNVIVLQIVLSGIVPLVISCFYKFRPVLTAIQLLYIFSLVLQFFSYIYWSYGTTKNFSINLTHLDSFYFALGTLSTAGTGNISTISETARRLQTFQMLIDFVLVGFVVALIVTRYSNLFSRSREEKAQQAIRQRSPIKHKTKLVSQPTRRRQPSWQRHRDARPGLARRTS